jgi:peptide/nickel transport system permease protein
MFAPMTPTVVESRLTSQTLRTAAALAKRLLSLVILLALLSAGIFALQFAAPGGAIGALTGGRPVSAEVLNQLRELYRLNDPVIVQYFAWLGRALHGDLGVSYVQNVSVGSLILDRGALSLQLAVFAFVLAMLLALPLAMLAATNSGGPIDRLASSVAILAIAVPSFAIGLLLLYVFGLSLNVLPVFGPGEGLTGRLTHLLLPAIALSISQVGLVVKITRAAMIDALSQDYVTFARSRGVGRTRVLFSYGLRNSATAIATAAGLTLSSLIVGTVLVEQIFALPGLGNLLVDSVTTGDVPVVQGISVVLAAGVISLNFLADGVGAAIDPRIDLSRAI